MASIYPRVNKQGIKTWQVMIRRAGEIPIIQSFASKEDADQFAKAGEKRIAFEREAARSPRSTLPESGDLADEKLLTTFSLFAKSDAMIKRHSRLIPTIVKHIGDVTIGKLKPSWITNFIARMRKQKTLRNGFFKYETIVSHLHMINVVLKWRAEQLDVPAPIFRVNTKKLPNGWAVKRERRLEAGEESKLMTRLRLLPGPSRYHWRLLVRIAMETGARLQEFLLAEWREISPGGDFWTIPAEHTKCKVTRVVPLTKMARRIFRLLKLLAKPGDPRMFHTLGKPDSVSALFHRWVGQAGIVNFRFHDLRHEGISRFVLTQRGYSVFEIMQIVGHSSPDMLRRYANLRGDELAKKIM